MKTINKYSWIIIFVLLYSCQDKMAYFIAESSSKDEAIKRLTFCNDYSYEIKPDSIRIYWGLDFKEVFLEKQFRYGRKQSQTLFDSIVRDKFQIICVLQNETSPNNMSFIYYVKIVKDTSITISKFYVKERLEFEQNCNLSIHSNSIDKRILFDSLKFGVYKSPDIEDTASIREKILIKIGDIEFIKK